MIRTYDSKYGFICPHCGHEDRDSNELLNDAVDHEELEVNCNSCGKDFKGHYSIEITYWSY